jgi:hypothetical protein
LLAENFVGDKTEKGQDRRFSALGRKNAELLKKHRCDPMGTDVHSFQ